MAQYYRVRPKYWKGDRRRWSDQEKLLGLYLLTCDHRNLEGLYWLPKGYVASDLGWPMKVVERAFDTLIAAGFCEYDETAGVVLVTAALAHQAPTTEKQVQGAVSALESVPDTSLWDAFMVGCRAAAPKLAAALTDASPGPFGCDPNGTGGTSVSDPNIAGEPARTRSSSSSSSSSPPQPPASGGSMVFPSRPGKTTSKRRRDQERSHAAEAEHRAAGRAFAAEHFPDEHPDAVLNTATVLAFSRIEPTVEAIRERLTASRDPLPESA